MRHVTSRQNPLLGRFRAAQHGELPDTILLDGAHLVSDALDAGLAMTEVAVSTGAVGRPSIVALLERLAHRDLAITQVSTAVMSALSPVRTPEGIVALAERPARSLDGGHPASALLVIAVGVQDPGNLGAIVRVAEAAGATGALITGGSADPLGWKALRGSMGSALRLPIGAELDAARAIATARRLGCRVVATAPRGGLPMFDADCGGPVAFLVGGEGQGLAPDLLAAADTTVTIPMAAPVESLNAAVAAALLLYEACRQRARRGSAISAAPTPVP